MNTEYEDPLWVAYGPFQPGSLARAVRWDNWQRGLKTCWYCLEAYEPQRFFDGSGKLRRLGRGRWYCSADCAKADRRRQAEARPLAEVIEADRDSLVLDLTHCPGCAA